MKNKDINKEIYKDTRGGYTKQNLNHISSCDRKKKKDLEVELIIGKDHKSTLLTLTNKTTFISCLKKN